MKHDGLYRTLVGRFVDQGRGWPRSRPCSCLVVFLGNRPLQPFYLFSYCFTSPICPCCSFHLYMYLFSINLVLLYCIGKRRPYQYGADRMILCCLLDIFSRQKKQRKLPHDGQLLASVAISSFLTQSRVDFSSHLPSRHTDIDLLQCRHTAFPNRSADGPDLELRCKPAARGDQLWPITVSCPLGCVKSPINLP